MSSHYWPISRACTHHEEVKLQWTQLLPNLYVVSPFRPTIDLKLLGKTVI